VQAVCNGQKAVPGSIAQSISDSVRFAISKRQNKGLLIDLVGNPEIAHLATKPHTPIIQKGS
jgi:hypothetical protein